MLSNVLSDGDGIEECELEPEKLKIKVKRERKQGYVVNRVANFYTFYLIVTHFLAGKLLRPHC